MALSRNGIALAMLVLAIGLAAGLVWFVAVFSAARSSFRIGSPKGCEIARYVTLPAEGYRLNDGTFIGKREFDHAVPIADGVVSFIDRAGRARCFRVSN